MSGQGAFRVELSHPPGWVRLPLLECPVGHRSELDAWTTSMAQRILAKRRGRAVRRVALDLARLTQDSWARQVRLGYAYYPPGSRRLLAQLRLEAFKPDRGNPVISLDLIERVYRERYADALNTAAKRRIDLPCGPAIRIRSMHVAEAGEWEAANLIEEVTHLVCPSEFNIAIIATISWQMLSLGDKLAAMADAIARTIVVTPE